MKVFIADDSALVRARLGLLVTQVKGVQLVGAAGNAAEALAAIQTLQPDVVILDIQMPGGNGIDVLQAVRRLPHVPVVIMLTAFAYPQYRQKCLAAGADYFFDKANEYECIPQVLAELLERAS